VHYYFCRRKTLACSAIGYEVTENETHDPKVGESLVIDFSLLPEPVMVPVA
jgi:hypothetical protein